MSAGGLRGLICRQEGKAGPGRDRYDDGGISGATLERPALKRLWAEFQAGRIDGVCRLLKSTGFRSMLDFLKLIELFRGVLKTTFVSVTQVVQYHRRGREEASQTSETFASSTRGDRGTIRDKFAASAKKAL